MTALLALCMCCFISGPPHLCPDLTKDSHRLDSSSLGRHALMGGCLSIEHVNFRGGSDLTDLTVYWFEIPGRITHRKRLRQITCLSFFWVDMGVSWLCCLG